MDGQMNVLINGHAGGWADGRADKRTDRRGLEETYADILRRKYEIIPRGEEDKLADECER